MEATARRQLLRTVALQVDIALQLLHRMVLLRPLREVMECPLLLPLTLLRHLILHLMELCLRVAMECPLLLPLTLLRHPILHLMEPCLQVAMELLLLLPQWLVVTNLEATGVK